MATVPDSAAVLGTGMCTAVVDKGLITGIYKAPFLTGAHRALQLLNTGAPQMH